MSKLSFSIGYIKLEDMYVAYKKAKSEAYYDSFHSNAQSFSEYESNISENLFSLWELINSKDHICWRNLDFIGGFRQAPKSLSDKEWKSKDNIHYRSTNPMDDWRQRYNDNNEKKLKPEFRLIMTPTVEFQIVSALWILKVGHLFDEKLNKLTSYGNRLRRKYHEDDINDSLNGPLNTDSPGLFNPYFVAYKKWRNDGLDSMRALLENESSVTAITMDLEGFYHNVSPDFLINEDFLKKVGLSLNPNDVGFTKLFISSMKKWHSQAKKFNLVKNKKQTCSLPVGLSASKIISNALLYELDTQIRNDLDPAYYGRYVDDIFLVFKTPDSCNDGNSILSYIETKVECIKIKNIHKKQYDLSVVFNYAKRSNLKFGAAKQKIFSLSGQHGLDFIDQISSQIKSQSSEYRMLPELPRNSTEMANKTLLASSDASLIPDALRKADVVSVRRLGFSLLLRDVESYTFDLTHPAWQEVRFEFYGLVERYLLTPKGIFELYVYLHRVFRLIIVCNDFDFASKFIKKMSLCFELIEETCDESQGVNIVSCKKYIGERLYDSALQSATAKGFNKWSDLLKVIDLLSKFDVDNSEAITEQRLKEVCKKVLYADFGYRPYKDYWYYSQEKDHPNSFDILNREVKRVLRLELIDNFRNSANLKKPHWPAVVFPTRPLSIQDIVHYCPPVLKSATFFKECIYALRGAGTFFNGNIGYSPFEKDEGTISVPSSHHLNVKVALTNYQTLDEHFDSALSGTPDESLIRYEKINKLINEILRNDQQTDYIVFPECSLPLRWAINISHRLGRQKKSLITGVEYYQQRGSSKIIRNDSLMSLTTVWPGYDSNLLILQPKLSPSHDEKKKLSDKGLTLFNPNSNGNEIFPIYRHGGFHFGVIICSDLTNPANRTRFQGLVDCLFVLEWNPDVKTFSYLIEGASHDTHSFVIQVNNRKYGDSRVRAPYRKEYMRDSVRVKGGISDTYIIAEIDFGPLRDFQKNGNMLADDSLFKPVPIGFEMCKTRM
ncbi:reverse transcriptase domain-containing protein [Pantoea allii]|uniref:reverse transcriptase domain-containing protein n=1 Tax=Pantoea allii TaxID=574096 RepID=UPI0024B779A5|nr:reverse transcriptase domain-containing protein [Pantoea allii]MDJ0090952.1 reverse transcriptase domain-containing protein [Pantoea allii]